MFSPPSDKFTISRQGSAEGPPTSVNGGPRTNWISVSYHGDEINIITVILTLWIFIWSCCDSMVGVLSVMDEKIGYSISHKSVHTKNCVIFCVSQIYDR